MGMYSTRKYVALYELKEQSLTTSNDERQQQAHGFECVGRAACGSNGSRMGLLLDDRYILICENSKESMPDDSTEPILS